MALFCLVHGSTQDASGWALLVWELETRGHETLRVDLPTDEPEATATRYAEVIAEAVRDTSDAPVVMAHSASGLFLPLLPNLCPVSRLVFLAAFVPEIGKSPMQQLQANPDMFWPDWIGKDPTKDDTIALQYLFHDCSPDTSVWALGTRRLMYARAALTNPYPLQRWPDVPMSYILCRDDRTLRPEFWRERVRTQLGIIPIELAGGHCPHVSRAGELAEVLCNLPRGPDGI